MARCDCCDLPVESCGKAVEQRQRIERRAHVEEMNRKGWIPSRYGGVCIECGHGYKVGGLIKGSIAGYKGECCA